MKKLILMIALVIVATPGARAAHPLSIQLFPWLAETIEDNWPTPLRYVSEDGLEDADCGDRPYDLITI